MKLFYTPGTCSMASHIVARELNLELQLEKVDLATKQTAAGADYTAINPKGYVPALQLDEGVLLTEGPAILQYLADRKPAANLAPANGTLARYQLQSLLGYINSELHKSYGPLFGGTLSAEARDAQVQYLRKRYGFIENLLQKGPYLTGAQFTIADAYLFTVTTWAAYVKVDLSDMKNLGAFQQRVAARPAVQAVLEREKAG
jgi:glutathione S-transferase